MAERRVLVVDDYPPLLDYLRGYLSSSGYTTLTALNGEEALKTVMDNFSGVILLDARLPDIDGLELFRRIKKINGDLPVIFITANASVDLAVEATKEGAFDFIEKGSELMNRVSIAVKNAFERLEMFTRLKALTTELSDDLRFGRFITINPLMRRILKTIESVIPSAVSVLIEGESGTGKELIARAIHDKGPRASGPFVAVNCAGIPETLLESEMFGYEKGAFTGATTRRIGKFELANGGTLFLDEVGELPRSLQAKLLRVLQERTFERVGGNEPVTVDVRVISATNRDLRAEVRAGNFREDLYYRLAVFPVRLLPLRERPEDIPFLAQHFLRRFSAEEGKEIKQFSPAALSMLTSHPFPGNVRELENIVRHLVILSRGPDITVDDVQATLRSHQVVEEPAFTAIEGDLDFRGRLSKAFPKIEAIRPFNEMKSEYIRRAVELANGNLSSAARALGLGRATLYRILKGKAIQD